MKYILLTSFLFTCLSIQASVGRDHDIHISLCELRWNDASSSFEVSIKIFIDDLELALEKKGISNLAIGTDREAAHADEQIANYLNQHFKIEIDGITLQPIFHGKEISPDLIAIWCFVEFACETRSPGKCILRNDILLELYDDQRNIMDIRMNKNHKAHTILEPGHSTWSYTY